MLHNLWSGDFSDTTRFLPEISRFLSRWQKKQDRILTRADFLPNHEACPDADSLHASSALAITGIESVSYDEPTGTVIVIIALNTTEAEPLLDPSESSPAKWYAWYDDQKFVGTALALAACVVQI